MSLCHCSNGGEANNATAWKTDDRGRASSPCRRRDARPPSSLFLRGGSGQEFDKHLVELPGVEFILDLDLSDIECGLVVIRPGQRVAIAVAAIQIDIHEAYFFGGDQAGVEPCRSC